MNNEYVMDELQKIGYKHYKSLTREKIAWMDWYLQLRDAGYIAYAITVTYKPNYFTGKGHSSKMIENYFNKLYFFNLARYYLFNGHKNWKEKFNEIQPYVEVFEEAHYHSAIHRPHLEEKIWKEFEFSLRLHHHAIMHVHPMHAEKMDQLIGENTLNQFNPDAVMTSWVDRVKDIGWTGYSLKCQHRFNSTSLHFGPQGVDFPPKL